MTLIKQTRNFIEIYFNLTLPVSDGTQTSTLPLKIANQLAPRSPVRKTIPGKRKFLISKKKEKNEKEFLTCNTFF
jgi:hypothetical protein